MWYIIANPAAGGGEVGRQWPRIEKLLQELGFSYTVRFTEARGHAIRLADDAVLKGYRYILGVGGDGTNNEIINGLMRQQHAPPAEVVYTLLPVGTGNDWVRAHGIPRDLRARLERLLEPKTKLHDVGLVRYQSAGIEQERYFANVAGMAYDAYIARRLSTQGGVHRLQYLWMVVRCLFEYQLTPAEIFFNGQRVEDHFYTINVGICPYSGGAMQLVPHAVPDDGLLALTFARRLSKLTVLLLTRRFYDGSILTHPRVGSDQTRHIRVQHLGNQPTLLEADGEFLGETPAEFSIVEKALQVAL